MNDIHESALVHPDAELGDRIEIGPYCTVGAGVRIGDGCRLISHVVIEGPNTLIGADNTVYPFSVLGAAPQVLDDAGEDTGLVIGDRNTFREMQSVHRGSGTDGQTRIGNDNLLMSHVHVGHDCTVGSHNVLASYVGLSGHVTVHDHVTMGGQAGVAQRRRVGSHSYIGGASAIDKDVPPYAAGYGNRLTIRHANVVGLRRNGFRPEAIRAIADAYRIYARSDLPTGEALQQIRETLGDVEEIHLFLAFFDTDGEGNDSTGPRTQP